MSLLQDQYRESTLWIPLFFYIELSNPRSHQKTMLFDLSKLFIQSLLARQD